MGFRFIFFIVAVIAIVMIVRFFAKSAKTISKPAQRKIQSQKMVACHICGLHVPEDEAVERDSHFYCSQEHASLKHDQSK